MCIGFSMCRFMHEVHEGHTLHHQPILVLCRLLLSKHASLCSIHGSEPRQQNDNSLRPAYNSTNFARISTGIRCPKLHESIISVGEGVHPGTTCLYVSCHIVHFRHSNSQRDIIYPPGHWLFTYCIGALLDSSRQSMWLPQMTMIFSQKEKICSYNTL